MRQKRLQSYERKLRNKDGKSTKLQDKCKKTAKLWNLFNEENIETNIDGGGKLKHADHISRLLIFTCAHTDATR